MKSLVGGTGTARMRDKPTTGRGAMINRKQFAAQVTQSASIALSAAIPALKAKRKRIGSNGGINLTTKDVILM
jgi:hypothetical protein